MEQIRDQQKESWNKFSGGWDKWDHLLMDFMQPMGDEMIRQLDLKDDDIVLDIATGTGEPGLSIAALVPEGKVVITDISDKMLAIAQKNAVEKGLTNVESIVCDVSDLPFPDNTFDAISCRFGFMFFPDMSLAAREMVRVLKLGGKLATSVWDVPEKNFWVTAAMGSINKNMTIPAPPPGAPGMFRCAKDGLITDLFEQAGLKNVHQVEVAGSLNCKTVDMYWDLMTDVAAPVVAALSKADQAMQEKIESEVKQKVADAFSEGDILIGSSSLVIYGEK